MPNNEIRTNSTDPRLADGGTVIASWLSASGTYKREDETILAYGKNAKGCLIAVRTHSGIYPAGIALPQLPVRTITATIASSHPRTRTFELAEGRAVDYDFGGPNKARIFYREWNSALQRYQSIPVVVLADSIQEV